MEIISFVVTFEGNNILESGQNSKVTVSDINRLYILWYTWGRDGVYSIDEENTSFNTSVWLYRLYLLICISQVVESWHVMNLWSIWWQIWRNRKQLQIHINLTDCQNEEFLCSTVSILFIPCRGYVSLVLKNIPLQNILILIVRIILR